MKAWRPLRSTHQTGEDPPDTDSAEADPFMLELFAPAGPAGPEAESPEVDGPVSVGPVTGPPSTDPPDTDPDGAKGGELSSATTITSKIPRV